MRKVFVLVFLLALAATPSGASALLKPTSGETQALQAKSLDVSAQLHGAFATTTVTTIYANPNSQRIEADFVYSAPQGSVVTGFAYWFGDEKVVARVVEKRRAARIYSYITTRQRDPALIEMIGKNSFRARIFPIQAGQDLKVEVQLAQSLPAVKTGALWSYPLRDEAGAELKHFALEIKSDGAARSNLGEFANGVLKIERDKFTATDDLRVVVAQNAAPLRASLFAARDGGADGFFVLALTPNVAVARPRIKVSGVQTYDVLVPQKTRVGAGESYVVFGRYRGNGRAIVALNEKSIELQFPDVAAAGNLATKLWAAQRIEMLSENESNQFAVVKLSQRFGLVSKWTSWLAIPAAEKERFDRETRRADRDNAGRAYAQALSRGDGKTADAQQKIFEALNVKLGEQRSLQNYIDDEYQRVSSAIRNAAANKTSDKQVAQWKNWRLNLEKRVDAQQREQLVARHRADRAYAEVKRLVPYYLQEIEAGRTSSQRAQNLKTRMTALSSSDAMKRHYGRTVRDFLAPESYRRIEVIAQIVARERADNKLSPARERDLKARISRLLPLANDGYGQRNLDVALEEGQHFVAQQLTDGARKNAIEQLKAGVPLSQVRDTLQTAWKNATAKVGARELPDKDNSLALTRGVAARLAAEVRAGRDLQPENVQLMSEWETLRVANRDRYDYSNDVKQAYQELAVREGEQWAAEVKRNGADSPDAKRLLAETQRLASRSHSAKEGAEFFTKSAYAGEAYNLSDQLAAKVANKQENTPAGLALQRQFETWRALPAEFGWNYEQRGDVFPYFDRNLTLSWKERAHETAYQLLEAQAKMPPDAARIAQLQTRLNQQAVPAKNEAEKFLSWEKSRIARGEPMLSAEEYRLRAGDPLISVIAPANCQRVIAITPDGTLVPLRFNALNGAWEARFDVPTYAASGRYETQIIIVNADGARHHLTMGYEVDGTAPQGVAAVTKADGAWNLTLQSDEFTDRVSAFTPWNARVELRRGEDGVFAAPVEVPAAWIGRRAIVTFVLTDAAHNRTTVKVDWN